MQKTFLGVRLVSARCAVGLLTHRVLLALAGILLCATAGLPGREQADSGYSTAGQAGRGTPAIAAPSAVAVPPAPAGPADALRADLDRILAGAGLAKTVVAARVLALGDPAGRAEVLYSVRADQPMIPASTMKLATTAACFDRFGPDWRLRTTVGRIPSAGKDARWDLAVIGGGDPNFSGRFWDGDPVGAFRKWAEALKARGVSALGGIVLDDTLFDAVLVHPHWPPDQRAEWYEAPVSALVINDGCVDVYVSPGKPGEPAVVRLEPPGGYAAVEGTILTAADRKDHRFAIERLAPSAPGGPMRLRVGGRFWVEAAEALEFRTLADPARAFGLALAETLRAEGIAVAGPVVRRRVCDKDGRAPADFTCDIIHTSRLDATAAVANKRSQGLYAECLLKLLGAHAPGAGPGGAGAPPADALLPPRQGSWAAGAEEVRRWMAEAGIPAEGCVIDDGSGLSKHNRLTAVAVTELLRGMVERYGDRFVQTLALPGEGSMAKRLRGTAAEGRVFGKTGYILGVSALSGYVRSRSGRVVVFSLLMNDVPWGELWKARDAQDKVCLRLVDM